MGVYYSCVNDRRMEYFDAIDVGNGVCKSGGVLNPTFAAMVVYVMWTRDSPTRDRSTSEWRLVGDFEHDGYKDVTKEVIEDATTHFGMLDLFALAKD
jgi:hypothetical protein